MAKTIIVTAIAAIGIIGAGLYFAPRKGANEAAGTVAPALRHKGEPAQSAAGDPSAPNSPRQPQAGLMPASSQTPGEQQKAADAPKQGNTNAPSQGNRKETPY